VIGTLIGWVLFGGYLVCAVLYARALITRWYDPNDSLAHDMGLRGISALGALGCGLIWPLTMVFLRLRDWLYRPAVAREERIVQLRQDITSWKRELAATDPDDPKRVMIENVLSALNDIAK
jgi:hypothetical protein